MAATVDRTRPSAAAGARRAGGDAGAGTASFVILFPILVIMFMALVQWGLYFHAQSLVDAAAQDATRAAQDADGTVADGRFVAEQLVAGATDSGLLDRVTITVDDRAGTVRATVRGRLRSLLPGFTLTVEGVSEATKERFTAEGDR